MFMNTATRDASPEAAKAKQANIRLTAEQNRLLKQHYNRNGATTQAVIIDALKQVIKGFSREGVGQGRRYIFYMI